jgi:hypothetical protein
MPMSSLFLLKPVSISDFWSRETELLARCGSRLKTFEKHRLTSPANTSYFLFCHCTYSRYVVRVCECRVCDIVDIEPGPFVIEPNMQLNSGGLTNSHIQALGESSY